MTRIDIYYGSEHYSIGGRSFDDLQREIEIGLRSGSHWLEVNDGEGSLRQAFLLLTPGVQVAVVPIPEAEAGAEPDGDHWQSARLTDNYD